MKGDNERLRAIIEQQADYIAVLYARLALFERVLHLDPEEADEAEIEDISNLDDAQITELVARRERLDAALKEVELS